MKTCPVCKATFADKAAIKAHYAAKHPGMLAGGSKPSKSKASKKNSRKKAKGIGPGASLGSNMANRQMEEYWGVCKPGITQLSCTPGKSNLPMLDQFAYMFELYRVLSWEVRFTVRVGSTVSGMYIAGASFNPNDTCSTLQEVSALSPKVHMAVWQPAVLSVPASRLMRQKDLFVPGIMKTESDDVLCGNVWVWVDGTSAQVDAWVRYNVSFTGPTRARRGEVTLRYDSKVKKWYLNDKEIKEIPAQDISYEVDVESNVDGVWDALSALFSDSRKYEALVNGAIRFWRYAVSGVVGGPLPTLGGDVVAHLSQRPFLAVGPGNASAGSLEGNCEAEEEACGSAENYSEAGERPGGQRYYDRLIESLRARIEGLERKVEQTSVQLGNSIEDLSVLSEEA